MNRDKKLGIYIHIPFCVKKCNYCDFLSGPYDEQVRNAYVEALCKEIMMTAGDNKAAVDSIFFGGGTPSVLSGEQIKRILDVIKSCFNISPYAEVTIECNPGTLDERKAYLYRESGINRLSFGLQSVNNERLKMLGRIHDFSDFEKSYSLAGKYGFDNINIDMMMSLPGQTIDDFLQELRTVVAFSPRHISVYSLILEEGTYLYENINMFPRLPSDEEDRLMYKKTIEFLAKHGYEQYEISNFAKKGYECIHNLGYWERSDYLGFGIGAASLVNGKRYSDITDISTYMKAESLDELHTDEVVLTKDDCMEEFVFLGLRKTEGINLDCFKLEFGVDFEKVYKDVLEKNISAGLLKREGSMLSLTSRGVDISNTVMSDFMLD